MERLAENKLIYGNLFEVATPVLRERYNRALELLYGKRTALERFRIDQSGFSPEVAEELGDPEYLNPHGCNRMFILLTLEQEDLPLLDLTFSSSRAILKGFIEDNRDALFALTARDAVFGELEDSVYKITTLSDLTSIKKIRVKLRTPGRLVYKADRLARRIETFMADDAAWANDALLQEMVELAEAVGDVREQSLVPERVCYEHGNFFTTHLGGLYVFNSTRRPTLVYCSPSSEASRVYEDETLGFRHIPINDRAAVARFLKEADLAEPFLDCPDLAPETLLEEKLEFIALDHADENGAPDDVWEPETLALRRYVQQNFDDLPAEFHALQGVLRAMEQGQASAQLEPGEAGYFYLLRSTQNPDRDLVNHLLGRLTPSDFRQLFICNKELFYELYQTWDERKRSYVADYLGRHYKGREAAVRERLFGRTATPGGPWGRRKQGNEDDGERSQGYRSFIPEAG